LPTFEEYNKIEKKKFKEGNWREN